jgi:hypothetical protein
MCSRPSNKTRYLFLLTLGSAFVYSLSDNPARCSESNDEQAAIKTIQEAGGKVDLVDNPKIGRRMIHVVLDKRSHVGDREREALVKLKHLQRLVVQNDEITDGWVASLLHQAGSLEEVWFEDCRGLETSVFDIKTYAGVSDPLRVRGMVLSVPSKGNESRKRKVVLKETRVADFWDLFDGLKLRRSHNREDDVVRAQFSPDGMRYDYRTVRAGKRIQSIDRWESAEYDTISIPRWGQDNRYWSFIASREGKRFVVSNGCEGSLFDRISSIWRFGPQGSHCAYAGKRGGKSVFVVDGKEGQEFDDLKNVGFSDDGQHWAHAGTRKGRFVMVKDGTETPTTYVLAGAPTFSPDGNRFAYIAVKSNKKWVVVLDGQEQPELEVVLAIAGRAMTHYDDGALSPGVLFSSNGKRYAFLTMENIGSPNEKYAMVIDGRKGERFAGTYPGIVPNLQPDRSYDSGFFLFSPDSEHYAYCVLVKREHKVFVVVDGKKGPLYDDLLWYAASRKWCVTFSRDNRLAYLVTRGGKSLIVVDGVEGPAFDEVYLTLKGFDDIFSPNGKRFAYRAKRGNKTAVVVDGKEVGQYDEAGFPRFSCEGNHVAFYAREGHENYVVCDGRKERAREGRFVLGVTPQGAPICISCGTKPFNTNFSDMAVTCGNREGRRCGIIDPESVLMNQDQSIVAFAANPEQTAVDTLGDLCVVVNDKIVARYNEQPWNERLPVLRETWKWVDTSYSANYFTRNSGHDVAVRAWMPERTRVRAWEYQRPLPDSALWLFPDRRCVFRPRHGCLVVWGIRELGYLYRMEIEIVE